MQAPTLLGLDAGEDNHTARRPRHLPLQVPVHVVNRGVDKRKIFFQAADYEAFLGFLSESASLYEVEVFGYNVLENHFHLVLRQHSPGAVSALLRRITCCSACHYRRQTSSVGLGHVYQSRFWSDVLADEAHYLVALRYVEANARRAGLARRAEAWRWGSLWERAGGDRELLAPSLVPLPENWAELVNLDQSDAELAPLRSLARTRTHFPPAFPHPTGKDVVVVEPPAATTPVAIRP
jgi:putative transposase